MADKEGLHEYKKGMKINLSNTLHSSVRLLLKQSDHCHAF